MKVRQPLTEEEKRYLMQRKEAGATLAQIANELDCTLATVRKWWRIQRDGRVVAPRGRAPRGVLSTFRADVREQAIALKRQHPHWGPAVVRVELAEQLDVALAQLPSVSRLAALFKEQCPQAVQVRTRRVYPEQRPAAVQRPHERWQIDSKEAVPWGEREVATILLVRDPVGALLIASRAFRTTTAKGWRKLTRYEVQDTLRRAFREWGCPLQIQTDREAVFAGAATSDFPALFTLWLRGVGIEHVLSRSRRPTDQAHVERSHRTLGDLVWKDEQWSTLARLQSALEQGRRRHNYHLPSQAAHCAGRPPLVAHPWATHSGRPFHAAREWDTFALHEADAYLAQQLWVRRVSESGSISWGSHLYYVGVAARGQTVTVRFHLPARTFRVQDATGTLLKEIAVRHLSKADLIGPLPDHLCLPVGFQFPLPLQGV